MKRFFNILFSLLFATGIVALAGYIYWNHLNSPLKTTIIRINRPHDSGFLDKKEFTKQISNELKNKTKKIKDIDCQEIEKTIKKNPWIQEADVFTDIEGNLIINVKEKDPLLRIFPKNNEGFYLDKDGNIIPLNTKYAPRVMVANGYINTKVVNNHYNIYDTVYKNNNLRDVLYLTKTLAKYPFAEKLIGEIYINSMGEIDMVPLIGTNIIRLGDTCNTGKKLENMIVFYQKALKYEGWNKYKILNLKYNNQIICTKN